MRREIFEYAGNFYAKITKSSFFNLYPELDHSLFFISTDQKWNMTQIPEFSSLEDFSKILNEYSYYNCTEETGISISFWIDISDFPLSKFNHFKLDYMHGRGVNYTTLVKQYMDGTKKE